MRSRELQQYLASITGRPLSEIDQRLRPLRGVTSKMIASGPRGLAAPHMDEGEAMLHFFSLVSKKPADSLDVLERIMRCRLVDHPAFPGLTNVFEGEGRRLPLFFLSMGRRDLSVSGFDLKSIEIQDDGSIAAVNFDRRLLKGLRFLFVDGTVNEPEKAYAAYDMVAAGNRFVIGASHVQTVLAKVALNATGDNDGE